MKEAPPEFTQEDLENWELYEDVRALGLYSMFNPSAREATGLSREQYIFVQKWYSELREWSKIPASERALCKAKS